MFRFVTCVVVSCDRCKTPGHPILDEIDGELHFTGVAEAARRLPGWRLDPDCGRALCAGCAVDEDCATYGHDLSDDVQGCGCHGRIPAHRAAMTVDAILTSTCPLPLRQCRRCLDHIEPDTLQLRD